MNNYLFRDRGGSTPIDTDQLTGINYSHVTTMGELDELEDRNIAEGILWLNRQKTKDYLNVQFIDKLHKKLFGDVWKWAGTHRTQMVNLSKIDYFEINIELKKLFEDVKVWIASQSITWDEIPAEFHHRLVSIHPYPNGNGRVARIMTEYLLKRNNQTVTNWMNSLKDKPKMRRDLYIKALQFADQGDYSKLIEYVKSK